MIAQGGRNAIFFYATLVFAALASLIEIFRPAYILAAFVKNKLEKL
jgi:SNF family Na+-dependent transporter